MTSFVEPGMITFRTRCLTLAKAAAFARALSANSRFDGVEIRESKRAVGEVRWFVCFLPVTPGRVEAMLERQQESREERALAQSFTVVADPDHDFLHVYSHVSCETYEVSLAGAHCSCPDHQYRLSGTGVLCKHIIAAADATRRGEVGHFKPIPDRRAEQERFAEIFGAANQDERR